MSSEFTIKSRRRDYQVHFIDNSADLLVDQVHDSFAIVDRRILEILDDRIVSVFPQERLVPVEATEQNKSLDYCRDVITTLCERKIRRNSKLLAVGGGVTQDMTAFIASILYRGIDWHFYPTTLLAQADSCIGGKTSINLDGYKNIVGNFYPPARVLIDLNFLRTLPVDQLKSGIGEILHYYLIANSPLLEDFIKDYDRFLKEPTSLADHIHASLKIKKEVIEIDEYDENERRVFNYGHTFGHAIETVSEYTVNHGQAVTMGMDLANYISYRLKELDEQSFHSMHRILARNMPSFVITGESLDSYLEALSRDKKNVGRNLGCILTRGPGRMMQVQLGIDDELRAMIAAYFDLGAR